MRAKHKSSTRILCFHTLLFVSVFHIVLALSSVFSLSDEMMFALLFGWKMPRRLASEMNWYTFFSLFFSTRSCPAFSVRVWVERLVCRRRGEWGGKKVAPNYIIVKSTRESTHITSLISSSTSSERYDFFQVSRCRARCCKSGSKKKKTFGSLSETHSEWSNSRRERRRNYRNQLAHSHARLDSLSPLIAFYQLISLSEKELESLSDLI